MDATELELFTRAVDQVTARSTGAELDAALDDLGWGDALADDRRAAVAVLFDRQGWANASSNALARVVAAGLGIGASGDDSGGEGGDGDDSDGDDSGGDDSDGEGGDVAVVLPPLGTWHAPGAIVGESLAVRGLALGSLARHRTAFVVATRSTPGTDVVVAVATAALALRPLQGVDPALGLAEVSADVPAVDAPRTARWPDAVAMARLALAHELVGAGRRMLELARAHAMERVQFGRTISTFQAVRHRLAETLVVLDAGEALIGAAWDDGSAQTAAMAKAVAGRGARTAARHCQQVLAGIGFTTEHPFHRYLRRVLVLDHLFGSARTLTRELGEQVVHARALPPLAPL
jgi:hypothetical protein